jgi:hypothetical protein
MYEKILQSVTLKSNQDLRIEAGKVDIRTGRPKFVIDIDAPEHAKNEIECRGIVIGTDEGYGEKFYYLSNKSGVQARIDLIEVIDIE